MISGITFQAKANNTKYINHKTSDNTFRNAVLAGHICLNKPLTSDVITFSSNKKNQNCDYYIENINKVSDFKQINPYLPDNGIYYCGPVSVSNGIKYLGECGYPNLVGNKTQLELIKELAKFLKTDKDGTTIQNMCDGLAKFVKSKGYSIKNLEYQGFRPIDNYHSGKIHLDMDQIKKAVKNNALVLLDLGLYKKPVTRNGSLNFDRIDGHWVTMVGYGYDGKNFKPDYLISHDPMDTSIAKINNTFMSVELIPNGTLIPSKYDTDSKYPQDAKGFYQIKNGINYLIPPEEVVILDGAIILELNKPE